MKVYGSNAIRNVAFVGHGASGKTSLVDALAFVSGASRRHGSIKDGTTLTDYSPDEIDRKHSINLGLGYAEWLDTKINLIDTPGYLDYFGEVVTGLHAADAAVVVLSGTGGVEVGTEKVWEVCDQLHLPRVLFVFTDGQGARRLRAGLQRREGPSDAPRSSRSRSRSATGTTSTGSSICSPVTATSIRRGPRAASTTWCRSPRNLFAAQVSLDQLVVGRGDGLGELLAVLLVARLVLRRDGHHLVFALGGALLVVVAVSGEEVDDPVEGGAVADGDLDRDHLGASGGPSRRGRPARSPRAPCPSGRRRGCGAGAAGRRLPRPSRCPPRPRRCRSPPPRRRRPRAGRSRPRRSSRGSPGYR